MWREMSVFRTYSGPEDGPWNLAVPYHWFCFTCLPSHSPTSCYFAICLLALNCSGMHKQKLADKVNLGASPRKILTYLLTNIRKCKGLLSPDGESHPMMQMASIQSIHFSHQKGI